MYFPDQNLFNKITLKCVPQCLIDNKTALVQMMIWRRTGDKSLSEPIMAFFTVTVKPVCNDHLYNESYYL